MIFLVRALLLLLLAMPATMAGAATPAVDIASGPLGVAGLRVPPNLLINLSLDHGAVAAAYPGAADYARGRQYIGYFDHATCYSYPQKGKPDPSEAAGYFSPFKAADERHECGGDSFSGNFMNWASASTLDILRYALTGGDRVIDTASLTVLQRAYLPEAGPNPDFYAHAAYFPRKAVGVGAAAGGSAPSQVTPFDTATLYIVSCRDRILFSSTRQGGRCDAAAATGATVSDKSLGEYRARVSVCDALEGPVRVDLCLAYGKRHKPVGSLQRHALGLRFGLLGYLTEHAEADVNLYGGVLRAPLAFVGQSRFEAPDFVAQTNPAPEWNANTGVLLAKGGKSGLINYLNRLGRGLPSRPGLYRSNAALGELYYESLRYLQGRQPSIPAPVTRDAGFQVVSNWIDPLQARCQRDVILTIGNSDTANDFYLPGNRRGGHADGARGSDSFGKLPALDVMDWTRRVGVLEADVRRGFGNAAPRSWLAPLDSLDTGDQGLASYYAAGLAYWGRASPMRPDWDGRIENYVIDLDRGGNGASADSGPRAIKPRDSQLYLMAKYGGFDDRNGDGNPFRTTFDVGNQSEWSDDGKDPHHYFLGSDPAALVGAVRAVFAAAVGAPARLPGGASMALQTAAGEPAFLFQSDYSSASRSGRLTRFALKTGAGGQPEIGAPLWEAGALLDARLDPRRIYTLTERQGTGGPRALTVPFEWGELSAAQQAALDRSPLMEDGAADDAEGDGLGRRRLAFLRGERALEMGQPGGMFRRRAGLLGDSVNGAPLHVGAPSAGAQGAAYAAFYQRYKGRRRMVYLGANDGMLHAFDAGSGVELFAYVPQMLTRFLNQLSSPSYGHRAFVDGTPGVGEALLAGQWKTVLVSGLGAGGQGLFALDITDPDNFAASGALWEFSDRDDAAMGNVMAAPLVARFRVGMRDKKPEYRDFAVVSSGWNNYADDGAAATAGGALFLLALDKPAGAAWQLGVNYYKLVTPVSLKSAANALGPPALVLGEGGVVRYAYAGDLQGNLWRFDFSGVAPWPGAVGPGAGTKPLFIALDTAGRRQPITQAPRVVYAPGGGFVVLFGSGQLIGVADTRRAGFLPQSFYAIRDGLELPALPVSGRESLAERTLSAATGGGLAIGGADFSYRGPDAKRGWYVDFPAAGETGERSVTNAVLAAGKVFFNTFLPGGDVCAGAMARAYAVDALSGFAFDGDGLAQSGLPTGELYREPIRSSPLLLATGTVLGGPDGTGRSSAKGGVAVLSLGVDGRRVLADGARTNDAVLAMPARRISWREVANWLDLHQAATE